MVIDRKRKSVTATIRTFCEADASAAARILRASPEASQWTVWGLGELLGWSGVVALVSEDGEAVEAFQRALSTSRADLSIEGAP